MRAARSRLRELIAGDDLICVPGVYDGLSAHLVQAAGFDAAYLTGAGVAVSAIGVPDIGLTTMTEVVLQAARLTACLDIPLIVDADTGFGNELNVFRTVRELERAGAAAIQIEDQGDYRRCGHLAGKTVAEPEVLEAKLAAAIEARTDADLVIIARTDARAPLGLQAAIDRARRYRTAGADVIFVEAPESLAEIERIAAEVDAPLMFNVVARGRTPVVTAELLTKLGYRLAIVPGIATKAAADAIGATLAQLRQPDGLDRAQQAMSSRALFDIVGLPEWTARQERFMAGQQESGRP